MTLFPFHHALSGPLTLWGNYQEVNKSFIQSCQYALHEPGVLWARCLNLPPSLGYFGFFFFFLLSTTPSLSTPFPLRCGAGAEHGHSPTAQEVDRRSSFDCGSWLLGVHGAP